MNWILEIMAVLFVLAMARLVKKWRKMRALEKEVRDLEQVAASLRRSIT